MLSSGIGKLLFLHLHTKKAILICLWLQEDNLLVIFGNTSENIGHGEGAFKYKWKRCPTYNGNDFLKNTLTNALQMKTGSLKIFHRKSLV